MMPINLLIGLTTQFNSFIYCYVAFDSVVDPDPNPDPSGSEIICKLGSGSESIIIFGSGFESGLEINLFPTEYKAVKMDRF
jgi:hypothetical protein